MGSGTRLAPVPSKKAAPVDAWPRRRGRRRARWRSRPPRPAPRAGVGTKAASSSARRGTRAPSRRAPGRGRARGRRWCPAWRAVAIASAKRTGSRTWRPSRRGRSPARRSSSSPVTLETIGIFGAWKSRVRGDLGELLQHRLHQGRVEGVGDGEALGLASLAPRNRCGSLRPRPRRRRSTVARRPVDRGDRQLASLPASDSATSCLGGLDRRPSPRPRAGAPIRRAPGGDQLGRVGEGEDAGDVGGGDLADRVAGEQVGLQAPRSRAPVRGRPRREQGGLGVGRCRSSSAAAFVALGEDDLLERAVEVRRRAARRPRRRPRRRRGRPRSSSLPMPSRWEPWPVKRKASLPSLALALRTSADSMRPRRGRRARRAALSRSPPATTARCSKAARVVASE